MQKLPPTISGVLLVASLLLSAQLLLLSADAANKGKAAPANNAKAAQRAKYAAAKKLAGEGLALYKQKNYPAAIEKLTAAADENPLDPSIQYYLGLAGLYGQDYHVAERALSRVVVMTPPTSGYYKNAIKCFENSRKELQKVKPYSCLIDGVKFWRWSSRRFPIQICVTNGLELPKGYSGGDLTPDKVAHVANWLRNGKFGRELTPYKHYRPEYLGYVKKGLSEWAFADTEGFLRFKTIDDPSRANVVVFWCAKLPNEAPGATVFSHKPGEPVIVQFAVETIDRLPMNLWDTLLQTIAAHEMGHAFGLQHSEFKRDIMYPTDKINYRARGTDQSGPNIVTPNDAATLRALYDLPAPILK